MTDALAFLLIRPENVLPTTTIMVVVVGMLVLAAVDVWRREVEDYAVVILLGISVAGMYLEGIQPMQWLGALLAAGIAFGVYLVLGMRGAMGGGDVKLSVVPAFVLGAVNPLVGIWWVACAILIHQGICLVYTRIRRRRAVLPHVPAMAAAAIIASVAFPPLL
ncbi:prepilin peptidase [Arthrobacter koreensis]|uniref:prepilin peptidase n=1 Tax=Arthrobacter koreensis TaxID=199136 RepID=UPI00382BADCD